MSLSRYWFEFAVEDGTVQHELLWAGAGVTGIDEGDCLGLLRDMVGAELPPVIRIVRGAEADRAARVIPPERPVGNASWRGVWWPVRA
jgi:hypothetical protein